MNCNVRYFILHFTNQITHKPQFHFSCHVYLATFISAMSSATDPVTF